MQLKTGVFFAAVVSGIIALSGCSSPQDTSESGAVAAEVTAEQSAVEETVVALPADHCLEGVWRAENEYFLSQMRQLGDEPKSVTGQVTLTFSDAGELTTVYDNWRIEMVVDGMESTIVREGTDRGTYQADANVLTVQEHELGSTITVTTAGMEMQPEVEPSNHAEASYTCDANTATIKTPDGDAILSRVR